MVMALALDVSLPSIYLSFFSDARFQFTKDTVVFGRVSGEAFGHDERG